MTGCCWEKIEAFQSMSEYNRFIRWIEHQESNGQCEEIIEPDADVSDAWKDRYFKCKKTGEVWKLSCPDPGYFRGSWLPREM